MVLKSYLTLKLLKPETIFFLFILRLAQEKKNLMKDLKIEVKTL